jgi:methionyl-tRNA formyltransferase
VVVVVSQPDRPRGRGRRSQPSPVSERALAAGVPLLRPERVAESLPALRDAAPDVGVVVAFGQFLPRAVRELPARGCCINAHASLLPRWRGAAPIARAILAGDAATGISVMRVEREMDAGPVALVRETPIGAQENCGELTERLAQLAAEALLEALARIESDTVVWREQDRAGASLAPKLERGEALLRFGEGAEALARRVRAFAPSPGAFTLWQGEPLRILAARAEPGGAAALPGSTRAGPDGLLRIACADGWLVALRLQRAGGRPLPSAEFLRGRSIPDGARLGD